MTSPHDPKQTLYLIDISSFIFRAFYAIRSLTSPKGEPTNAVFGVAQMLQSFLDLAKPEFVAITYDSPEPSFREEIYEEYKANRSAPPEELVPQFDRVETLVKHMGFHAFRQPGLEADDLIATLTKLWCKESPKHEVVIVTGDKDLMQLVCDRVSVWDTMASKLYTPKEVQEKFGVRPDQICDYLALVGDSSDNIPGVDGIGPKGAVDLIGKYNDLEGVLAAAKKGEIPGKKGDTIRAQESNARLSQKLATMREDCPLDFKALDFKYAFKPTPDFLSFLTEMGFNALHKRYSGLTGAAPTLEVTRDENLPFECIQDEQSFDKLLEQLERSPEISLDLETTSLEPLSAEIVGVALSIDPARSFYIPVGHTEGKQLPRDSVLQRLKSFIERPRYKKVGQNLKYDFSVLAAQGFKPDGLGADTMVASYVLEPEGRHNLDTLAKKHLAYTMLSYEEVCGKGKDQISFAQVPIDRATRYSAEDAWIALKLWRKMKPELEQSGLMRIFAEVDLPLVPVLSRMELQGVHLDVDFLAELSREFEGEIELISKKIAAYAKGEINLNSPKQLAKLLFEDLGLPHQGKTKTGYSTDASVLEALYDHHEVPKLLLEYREIAKLKGTYVDPLPAMRSSKDHKIHAGFHQTVAATGRLSSSDPNLQNIPIRTERGKLIRKAFLPSQGNVLVSADYSQIELRLLAHMSGDPELVRSFKADEDVHQRTASEIYGVSPKEVNESQRAVAKAINFGLMYGKTAFGLSQELKIPRREAQEMIDRYFTRYSGVKRFLDAQIAGAKENGFVTTLLGRKRRLPDIHSQNHAVRANSERMAMNSPIQGTAADLIKMAMIRLDERLSSGGYKAKMIIQVHDELVIDCPKTEVKEVERLVTETMESAMELSVPLSVNAGNGANWMEIS